jgi:hypothetical protein
MERGQEEAADGKGATPRRRRSPRSRLCGRGSAWGQGQEKNFSICRRQELDYLLVNASEQDDSRPFFSRYITREQCYVFREIKTLDSVMLCLVSDSSHPCMLKSVCCIARVLVLVCLSLGLQLASLQPTC